MTVERVDLDHQGWTYSSYVRAGDFLFTSICSGQGETITEQTESALATLKRYLSDAGATLEDVIKVTVTFKRGENFDEMKPVFRRHFPNGYPARNTILVDEFLAPTIKLQIEAIAYKPQA
ncbi:MAG: RidA family protein [Anaerolineae bacterium]